VRNAIVNAGGASTPVVSFLSVHEVIKGGGERVLQVALLLATAALGVDAATLTFRCAPQNDLYRAITSSGRTYPRFDRVEDAMRAAPRGSGVAILADGYPSETTQISPAVLQEAFAKRLRLYIEYPAPMPGLDSGEPRDAEWERGVVASDAFGRELKRLSILALGRCRFVPMHAAKPDLVLARVAGFDTAVYGLPEREVYPLLFEQRQGRLLIASTKLSQFVTARYAPAEAWTTVWTHIFGWLSTGGSRPRLEWSPSVLPSFTATAELPAEAEANAFRRAATWFERARLFPPPGEGSAGVMEGVTSAIRYDGSQPLAPTLRADCTAEVAMALAFAGGRDTAARLNQFLYSTSVLARGARGDPAGPSYGLIGWSLPNSAGVYYGDDNARAILGTLATAALLGETQWDDRVLEALLANLRTTGRLGFRRNRIEEADLQRLGWRHFYDEELTNYAPHYEGYLWASLLWAYDKTHFAPFLERARTAIRMTMGAYPAEWRWTNGIQQERARMLLPLAWLIRVEDTPEHREWLWHIAGDLLALQNEAGAIREEVGSEGHGAYAPPQSNEEYGAREAPLLQRNGDPVSDLLYTSNFALLGLHEAADATGDPRYAGAEDRLARFLCRIQTRSSAHPDLDGAWFRAFDSRRWEYWGSNADVGWGAWSIESGWTQGWISSVLAMRQTKTSLWRLTSGSRIGARAPEIIGRMLPANAAAAR